MTEPLTLPAATLDALIDVGNKALADYYHERACSCSTWPESCHSKLGAWQWETDAFAIALPVLLAAWQAMQGAADRARVLKQAAGHLQRGADAMSGEGDHGRGLQSGMRESAVILANGLAVQADADFWVNPSA